MTLPVRQLGPFEVSAIGLGCMNLSHAYGTPPPIEQSAAVVHRAIELGINHLDTAALYGFGLNESLLGKVLGPLRSKIILASKCGMTGVDGRRTINGRPEVLKRTCEEALARLNTDVIDLYYLHRVDKNVPLEESMGALVDLVREGKVRELGLSEVSAATLRRAYAIHPIAAVQSEYSLWTREPEIALLDQCRRLDVSFVAFSPLARGFLTSTLRHLSFTERDIRRMMPRFQPENFSHNLKLLDPYQALAREAGCTPAQLALAWLLAKSDNILPIPGTTRVEHLEENFGAVSVGLSDEIVRRVEALISQDTVSGARYIEATQREIDTETFPSKTKEEARS
jgi:aryl-alcohol dehydrogenase-like predicted oxidoreductase